MDDLQRIERNGMRKGILLTFCPLPRRAYAICEDNMTIADLWRMGYLSAGETGEDDNGKWQMFSLTDEGKRLLNQAVTDGL